MILLMSYSSCNHIRIISQIVAFPPQVDGWRAMCRFSFASPFHASVMYWHALCGGEPSICGIWVFKFLKVLNPTASAKNNEQSVLKGSPKKTLPKTKWSIHGKMMYRRPRSWGKVLHSNSSSSWLLVPGGLFWFWRERPICYCAFGVYS